MCLVLHHQSWDHLATGWGESSTQFFGPHTWDASPMSPSNRTGFQTPEESRLDTQIQPERQRNSYRCRCVERCADVSVYMASAHPWTWVRTHMHVSWYTQMYTQVSMHRYVIKSMERTTSNDTPAAMPTPTAWFLISKSHSPMK